MNSKTKLLKDESLNFVNFRRKLDSVIHLCRKSENKKRTEKRRNKKNLTKSLDKNIEKLSYPNQTSQSSFFVRNGNNIFKEKRISFFENHSMDIIQKEKKPIIKETSLKKPEITKEKNKENPLSMEQSNENNSLSIEINEFMENDKEKFMEKFNFDGNEEGTIPKLKEIIYKLQLRDAMHRQKIIKLQSSYERLAKNADKLQIENLKLIEQNKQECKNSKNIANYFENEKKKVISLEKKMKKLDPIETAKLMEKLHEKNEDLSKDNKKLEEMVKQLLLNREITRIRKLYPTIIENIPKTNHNLTLNLSKSEKEEEDSIKKRENYNKNCSSDEKSKTSSLEIVDQNNLKKPKLKNVCLNLNEILKGL